MTRILKILYSKNYNHILISFIVSYMFYQKFYFWEELLELLSLPRYFRFENKKKPFCIEFTISTMLLILSHISYVIFPNKVTKGRR